ncbi:hypothetical protein ARMGADRAFT_1172321 [Armillaria gallica]|uniref:F-box domain-containing protein n=1 Tax=Armillaria gallica TaxID=47427 RepID=A0A2H3CS81_ARMGA|nr:hypothetical protein ARMGADRAFT_1172321 [Armillaria gallica]
MELPSLKELTLTTRCDVELGGKVIKCPARALGALRELLLRSQCSLTQLHLIDPVLDNNLAHIIRLVPNLQELIIEFYEWVEDYDPVMQSLVTRLSEVSLVGGSLQHCAVPTLQMLGVNLLDFSHTRVSFINSAFVDMVASRLHQPSGVPRLTKLQLYIGPGRHYLDEADKNALMSLRVHGLKLDLNSDNLDEDPVFE